MRIGIDVGGTFTDVVLVDDAASRTTIVKVATTPGDPVRGALEGISQVLSAGGRNAADIAFVGHGTTIATNLVVEGKGAKTALITTRGFRDVLEIRRASRHDRADLYDLFFTSPAPLVARELRFEAQERVRYDGSVEQALSEAEIARLVALLRTTDVEAVAICLLNSHVNDVHERRLALALRERLAGIFVSASFEVNPEILEYERTCTTVMNALLGPRCASYIRGFEGRLREMGARADVMFMRSNGGLATPAHTSELPVTLLESGPAGGVTAAAKLCERLGVPNVICGDMGGTTFDVSLIRNYRAEVRSISYVHTHAVRAPTIDIESIGAGGGSIAWIDEGGGLHVGPRSAGADPGPACYGRGGERATVTDCNLVLGFVDPESFLGGSFALDVQAAHRIVERELARPLGKSTIEAARIVRAIANTHMAQAVRLMTIERGYDPREFAYLCYGGGGPLHAVDLAAELGVPTVIVPQLPGLFSAFGMLVADQLYDLQLPVLRNLGELDAPALRALLDRLEGAMREQLARAKVTDATMHIDRRIDCRYSGQSEALTIDVPDGAVDDAALARIQREFEKAHLRQWNFIQPDRPITVVNLRAQAVLSTGLKRAVVQAPNATDPPAPRGERTIVLTEQPQRLPAYSRSSLCPGHEIAGPAVIEEQSSCLVFRQGDICRVDLEGNLIVTVAG